MPLVNVVKKVDKAREAIGLAEGEGVVAGCTTNPKGTVSRMTARQLGGLLGAVAADRFGSSPAIDETGLAERFVPGQNFLVVTTHRVLLVSMGSFSGKPKDLVGQWRRDEVAYITVEEGRLAHPMTIVFVDGTAVQVEGAKGSDPKSVAHAVAVR